MAWCCSRRVIVPIVFVVIAGGMYGVFQRIRTSPSEETASSQQILDFSLPDASGNMVTLSDITAQVRVVHFWASWSPYSADDLRTLADLKQRFGDRIEIVALNRDTHPADGRAFLANLGLGEEVTFVYDTDDQYFREIGGYHMPETVFLTEDDTVYTRVRGPMSYDEMVTVMDTLLP